MNKLDLSAKKAEQEGFGQLSLICPPSLPPYTYSFEFLDMMVESGVDILFMPFMSPQVRMPWMMGGTEQVVDYEAVTSGITADMNFELIAHARKKYKDMPIVVVSFFNDVMAYGIDRFVEKCRELEVDGIDTPGYSFVTNKDYTGYGAKLAAANVHLIHPISAEVAMAEEGTGDCELLIELLKNGRGFVFIMADSAGKSGATGLLPVDTLQPAVARIKALQKELGVVTCPVITVCGVSSAQNGKEAVTDIGSDGVLLMSAVVRKIQAGETLGQIGEFLNGIKQAMKK